MKSYPSIPKKLNTELDIYAFDKLDGSNIRAEWDKKKGFWKFGSRTRLLGPDQGVLYTAQDLIVEKYGDDLAEIFKKAKYQKAVCFFEFFGPSSCFGTHQEDEEHDVVLFDVNPHKKGILPPNEFIKAYGHLDIPAVLYHGKANQEFFEAVKKSKFEGVTDEGVVCKGIRSRQTVMFKIKSDAWLKRLREYCGENDKLFEKLS